MSGLCFCGKQRTKNSTQCRFHHNTATKYYRRAIADPQWVEAVKNKGREKAKELKLETFNAYGGPICVCCGEEHIEFLSIDHINGRKDEPKDERKKSGNNLYRWLKNNDYPTGFRVLCMNCNFSRGHAGYCPHERFKAESQ